MAFVFLSPIRGIYSLPQTSAAKRWQLDPAPSGCCCGSCASLCVPQPLIGKDGSLCRHPHGVPWVQPGLGDRGLGIPWCSAWVRLVMLFSACALVS